MLSLVTAEGRISSGLAAVFLENRAGLLRFLRARGAGDVAEDLLQEVWLKISAATHAPVGEPLPYIYRIASNVLLDRRRGDLRRQRRESDWSSQVAEASERVAISPNEQAAIAREELRLVNDILAGLGDRTAKIFRRYRLEGVGQREIADEMGISLSAVEKHLQKAYRALLELRRSLDAG